MALSGAAVAQPGVFGVVLTGGEGAPRIAQVVTGEAAARAGVQVGDRLIALNGTPCPSASVTRGWLWRGVPGQRMRWRIERSVAPTGGKPKDGAKPTDPLEPEPEPEPATRTFEVDLIPEAWSEAVAERRSMPTSARTEGKAPPWHWEQRSPAQKGAPKGTQAVQGYAGRTTVLLFYQAHCPLCVRRALGVHRELEQRMLKGPGAVQSALVHSVFEGFDHNTFEAGVAAARKAGWRGAVFEDARRDVSSIPESFRSFGARHTPWTVLIDHRGRIAWAGTTPAKAERLWQQIVHLESQRKKAKPSPGQAGESAGDGKPSAGQRQGRRQG